MMQHTNIIPVRIGCQAMADGINPLWLEIDTQTELAQIFHQIRIINVQEIVKATIFVTAHTASLVDKALALRFKRSTQNLKSP